MMSPSEEARHMDAAHQLGGRAASVGLGAREGSCTVVW